MGVRIESHAEPIPGYRLMERLGGGGFGEVWKAEAPGGLHKAIKFVYGDLETASEDGQRAEQELKAMSRVKASGVLRSSETMFDATRTFISSGKSGTVA